MGCKKNQWRKHPFFCGTQFEPKIKKPPSTRRAAAADREAREHLSHQNHRHDPETLRKMEYLRLVHEYWDCRCGDMVWGGPVSQKYWISRGSGSLDGSLCTLYILGGGRRKCTNNRALGCRDVYELHDTSLSQHHACKRQLAEKLALRLVKQSEDPCTDQSLIWMVSPMTKHCAGFFSPVPGLSPNPHNPVGGGGGCPTMLVGEGGLTPPPSVFRGAPIFR